MNTKTQKANENYRRKFYELGLDSNFEYVGFEKKDRIWFRCKKCGRVAPRGNDAVKGRQQKLICRACGNGSILYSPFVDEVLAYYADGHTTAETCEKFFINKAKLNDWVKRRHVSNGRTFEQGGRESNKARAEATAFPGTKNKSYYARAKLHGAPAEVGITLNKLIKRDGLTCKICGLPCLYYGDYLADLYPTMDHIIPISKGGGHTWDNVQVAHRICNRNKSDHIGREWNNAD
jgi:hypothetical protein